MRVPTGAALRSKVRGEVEYRAGTGDGDGDGVVHPESLWVGDEVMKVFKV